MPVFHKGERQESVRDKMKAAKFTFPAKTDGDTVFVALVARFGVDMLALRLAEAVGAAAPDIAVLTKKPTRARPKQEAKEEKPGKK